MSTTSTKSDPRPVDREIFKAHARNRKGTMLATELRREAKPGQRSISANKVIALATRLGLTCSPESVKITQEIFASHDPVMEAIIKTQPSTAKMLVKNDNVKPAKPSEISEVRTQRRSKVDRIASKLPNIAAWNNDKTECDYCGRARREHDVTERWECVIMLEEFYDFSDEFVKAAAERLYLVLPHLFGESEARDFRKYVRSLAKTWKEGEAPTPAATKAWQRVDQAKLSEAFGLVPVRNGAEKVSMKLLRQIAKAIDCTVTADYKPRNSTETCVAFMVPRRNSYKLFVRMGIEIDRLELTDVLVPKMAQRKLGTSFVIHFPGLTA